MICRQDHHVGIRLKNMMQDFYRLEFERNQDAWRLPPSQGGLHAWERRVLLATWLAASWDSLRNEEDFLRTAFVSTGFLVAKDGSENHLVKAGGVDNYDYQSGDVDSGSDSE